VEILTLVSRFSTKGILYLNGTLYVTFWDFGDFKHSVPIGTLYLLGTLFTQFSVLFLTHGEKMGFRKVEEKKMVIYSDQNN